MDVEEKGDQLIFHHRENVEAVLREANELREFGDNGFTEGRHMRQIGLVPVSVALQHPEWMADPSLVKKWLNSDEGRRFRTVRKKL